MLAQYRVLRHDVYQLIKTDEVPEFIHLDKAVSANLDDEEVWIETMHYNDKNHWLEARARKRRQVSTRLARVCQSSYTQFKCDL